MANWQEVQSDTRYQKATPEIQSQIRNDFFDSTIGSEIPDGVDIEPIRQEFLKRTEPAPQKGFIGKLVDRVQDETRQAFGGGTLTEKGLMKPVQQTSPRKPQTGFTQKPIVQAMPEIGTESLSNANPNKLNYARELTPKPKRSLGDYYGDTANAVAKIPATAAKGVVDIANLVTQDSVDIGASKTLEEGLKAFDATFGSDALTYENEEFARISNSNNQGIADQAEYLLQNPTQILDKGITTIGSAFLPAGVASGALGVASKLLGSRLTPALAAKITGASVSGTIAMQNAADTFNDPDIAKLSLEERNEAAAITMVGTLFGNKLFGGGLEKAIADKFNKAGVAQGFMLAGKEAGQEASESLSQSAAKEVVAPETMNMNKALGGAFSSGLLGGVVGGGFVGAQSPTPQTRGQRIIETLKARKAAQEQAFTSANSQAVTPNATADNLLDQVNAYTNNQAIDASQLLEDENGNADTNATLATGLANEPSNNAITSGADSLQATGSDQQGVGIYDSPKTLEQTNASNLAMGARANEPNTPLDNPTPEPQATLTAQADAFIAGNKPALLITDGETLPQNLPNDVKTAVIPNRGTLAYRDDNSLQQALNGNMGEALGYGINEKPAQPTNVVTARDANGTVIQDVASDGRQSVVDAAKQVAGNGTVETRTIESALAERQAGVSTQNAITSENGKLPNTKPVLASASPQVENNTGESFQSNPANLEPQSPISKVSKSKKRAPIPTNLLQTIKSLGGINSKYFRDIMGETKLANAGYNRKAFNTTSKFSLDDHATDGSLDEYVPHHLRSLNYSDMGQDFDPAETVNYVAELLASGERNILPYDVREELKNSAMYERYNGSAEADIETIAELYTDAEINGLLREAGYDEREATTDEQVFEDNQNEQIESQQGSTQSGGKTTLEKPITQSTNSDIVSGEGTPSGNASGAKPKLDVSTKPDFIDTSAKRVDETAKDGQVASSKDNATDKTPLKASNTAQNSTDLLGENTQAKQAIADAARAKDAKRNTGTDNASEFNLSGSDSEADKAIASGAQALFEQPAKPTSKIDDFGEKLEGARKDMVRALANEYSDDEIASLPLSKLWPATDINMIENKTAAAVAFAARQMIPKKPRKYGLKKWVDDVKMLREIGRKFSTALDRDAESVLNKFRDAKIGHLNEKVALLDAIDRDAWNRIGEVIEYPEAYGYVDGVKQYNPTVRVMVDGKNNSFNASSVADVIDQVNALLGKEVQAARMKFEVRGRAGKYFINKTGDKNYTKLKEFNDTNSLAAFAYIKENYTDLLTAWEATKDRLNVKETDVRGKENKPRTGEDYRKGKDVSTEEFGTTFGFRGVQFGEWVKQGGKDNDRQGALNAAYDALMDLANIVNVPPKALSLEGTLGLSFGARGKGKFSAHFEPGNLVINLTKTKGAGALAHEWFHALDNYFSRKRGAKSMAEVGNTQQGYREENYITYKPEPLFVHNKFGGKGLTKGELARRQQQNPQGKYFAEESWIKDPKHPAGVRPEVEERFAALVEALDTSPMKGRASNIDAGKENGYWSQIIERAARSFENYVINKMQLKGYDNDYLANVVKVDAFGRDSSRFPYLLDEEIAPVAEAFDNLFGDIETKETNAGVALFSNSTTKGNLTVAAVKAAIANDIYNQEVDVYATLEDAPDYVQSQAKSEGATGVEGFFDRRTNRVALVASNIFDLMRAVAVARHELISHYGIENMMTKDEFQRLLKSVLFAEKNGNKAIKEISAYVLNSQKALRIKSTDTPAEVASKEQRRAKEIIAVMAERNIQNSITKRVIDAVRLFLKKIGFTKGDVTDAKIAGLLRDAQVYLKAKGRSVVEGGLQASFSNNDNPYKPSEKLVNDLLQSAYKNKGITKFGGGNYLVATMNKLNRGIFVVNGNIDREIYGQIIAEAKANNLDTKKIYAYSKSASYTGTSITAIKLDEFVKVDGYLNNNDISFSNNATKDIPDAIILNPLGTAKNDIDYEAAKAGDVVAATRLAKKLITNDVLKQLKEQIKNADLVVGVTSIEQSGKNALPEAAAILIADKLSLKYDENLLQLVSPKRTGMNGMDRIFNRPVFEGDVQPNASYILVDDTITQGGTFAAMANRINDGGANVIANIALTGKDYSSKIAISDSMLEKVRSQFGDLENEFRAITKYGFEGLTHSEARFVTLGNAPDKFRDRIIAETKKAASSTDTSTAKAGQDVSFSNNPTPPTGGVFTSQLPLNANFEIPQTSKLDNVLRSVQDKNIDLKRVTANIKKAVGEIADNINAYLQEELYHERSAKRTKNFLLNELNPLITAMQTRGVTMADFEEYLWARHAEERNSQIAKVNPDMPDGGSGLTTKEANDYLNGLSDGQKRNFDALAKRVDAITKGTRQVLVDYNLESAGTVLAMEGAYKNYVPLMREDMDNGFGMGTEQGFSVKGNSGKRATGSKRAVVDILANIAQQRERNIIRGEKNRVSTALVGLTKLNPNAEFWSIDTPPKVKTISKITGLVEEYTDPTYKNRNNVVVARIADKNGNIQERAVVFNERNERAVKMALNLKNLDQDQMGWLLSNASVITRYFSSINTQYNPLFGIINFIRDVQGALLNLSSTALKGMQVQVLAEAAKTIGPLYKEVRAIQKTGKSTNSDVARLYDEFQMEGGKTAYKDMYRNAAERGKAIEKMLDPKWWQQTLGGKIISANGLLAVPEQFLTDKAIKPLFNWLSDYNEALENTVRLATYKVGLDKGLSKQQAASVAKNISVNFNRKGTVGAQVGSLYAFFNASVQGSARIAETLLVNDNGNISVSRVGKQIIGGGLLLGAMQALAMAAAGFDDEEPPEHVRDRNIIIPTASGKYIAIPMPLGFNAIPAFGRIMTEWALSGGENTGDRIVHMMDVLLNVANPIGNAGLSIQTVAPTLLDPLVALKENKDFTGRKIAKEDMNSKNPTPGYTRAKDTASAFSTGIAYFINSASGGNQYRKGALSPTPDQVDYLIGQATGGVGREGMKIGGALDSLYEGEEIPNYKIPLVGKFYGNAKNKDAERTAYYDNIVELNKLEDEYKGRMENKDGLNEFKDDNPLVKAIQLANGTDKAVTKLTKQRNKLKEIGVPKERINLINELIALKMKRLNDSVRKIQAEQ